MNNNITKLHLIIGEIEIKYEGSESFSKDDISNIMNTMSNLFKEHGSSQAAASLFDTKEGIDETHASLVKNLSMETIASRMNVNNGPDLAMAASVYLTINKKEEAFSRTDILNTMKESKSYYTANMSSNLSKSLKGLVKNKRLNQTAQNTYALTASEKKTMEGLLA